MRTVTIEVKGRTDGDVEIAMEEVSRLLGEGFLSGTNSNDSGSFCFNVSGEEEPADEG